MSARTQFEMAARIDELVSEFEDAWHSGEAPRIEDFLNNAADINHELLLIELIATELELSGASEPPQPAVYLERFPSFSDAIETLFDRLTTVGPRNNDHELQAVETVAAQAGETFGKFHSLEPIGRGGMGVVYKAIQTDLSRTVALKMLRSGTLAGPTEIGRFREEVDSLAKLDHPHIVRVHEYGEHGGIRFFTMPFIDGETLADVVKSRVLPVREAVVLVHGVVDALVHAHGEGVIHRDLKPGNVMIARDGRPRILDFGLAANRDRDATLTRTGEVMGTPSFMSPEQARGATGSVAEATDIYSAGALLYFLLVGRPPHLGGTPLDTMNSVINDEAVRPTAMVRGLPADVETICLKCLEKSPGQRYATAADLAADLKLFLDGRPIKARPVAWATRAVRWSKRNPWPTTVGVLLLLLGCAGLGVGAAFMQLARVEHDRAEDEKLLRAQAVLSATEAEAFARSAVIMSAQFGAAQNNLRPVNNLRTKHSQRPTLGAAVALSGLPGPMKVHTSARDGIWEFLAAVQSPDGSRIATTDAGGTVSVFDSKTGGLLRTLSRGRLVVEGTRKGFTARHSQNERVLEPQLYTSVAWLSNPERLALTLDDGRCVLVDPSRECGETTAFEAQLHAGPEPLALCASDGDKRLVIATDAGTIILFTDGKRVATHRLGVPATALRFCHDRWLVASESKLFALGLVDLEVESELVTGYPVWDIAPISGSDDVLLAGNYAGIQVAATSPLRAVRTLNADSTVALTGFEACAWLPQRQEVRAIDHAGIVHRWLPGRDQSHVLGRAFRHTRVRNQPVSVRYRSAVGIFEQEDRVLVASADGSLNGWGNEQPPGEAEFTELPIKLGPGPTIRSRENLLWALDQDGRLSVFNQSWNLIAAVDAHAPRQRIPRLVLIGSDRAATLLEETNIRTWRLRDGKLIPEGVFHSQEPVMSLAVSEAGGLLAGVDVAGRVNVWNLHTCRRLVVRAIGGTRERPVSGAVAFSPDGEYVAACGPHQTSVVLEPRTGRFEGVLEIAGLGGTYLHWAAGSDWILAADAQPKMRLLPGPAAIDLDRGRRSVDGHLIDVVDIDGELVLLGNSGRVEIRSGLHFIAQHDFYSGVEDAVSVAGDTGQLVLAASSGRVFRRRLEDEPPEVVRSLKASVQHVAGPFRSGPALFGNDAAGRLTITNVDFRSRETRFHEGGILRLTTLTDSGWNTERLFPKWQPYCCSPLYAFNGHEYLAFRNQPVRAPDDDGETYGADVILATRTGGAGDWTFETIQRNANTGHHPLIHFGKNGSVDGVLHYDQHWLAMNYSRRADADETGWPWERIGPAVGMHARGVSTAGHTYLVARSHRHNGDGFGSYLGEWDGESLKIHRAPPTHRFDTDVLMTASGPSSLATSHDPTKPGVFIGGDYDGLSAPPTARYATVDEAGCLYTVAQQRRSGLITIWKRKHEKWIPYSVSANVDGPAYRLIARDGNIHLLCHTSKSGAIVSVSAPE